MNDENNHQKWIQPFMKPFLEGISGKSKTNDLEKNRNKGSSFNVQQYNNKFYAINVALGWNICKGLRVLENDAEEKIEIRGSFWKVQKM